MAGELNLDQMVEEALTRLRASLEYHTTFAHLAQLSDVRAARDRRDHRLALMALDLRGQDSLVLRQAQGRVLRQGRTPVELVYVTPTYLDFKLKESRYGYR
jgi:hypothetical protein